MTTTHRGRRPGNRVTQKMIADYAGVSVPTVSLALSGHPRVNERTRQQILRAGEALGYLPLAQDGDVVPSANGHGHSHAAGSGVGSAVPHGIGIGNGNLAAAADAAGGGEGGGATGCRQAALLFFGDRASYLPNIEMLQMLSENASERGMRLELHSIQVTPDSGTPADAVNLAAMRERLREASSGVDGMLVTSHVEPRVLQLLRELGKPFVMLGHLVASPLEEVQFPGLSSVGYDDQAMGRLATQSLLERREGPVAFISRRGTRGQYYERWYEGYQLAHIDAGLPVDPRWTWRSEAAVSALDVVQEIQSRIQAGTVGGTVSYVLPEQGFARNFVDLMAGLGLPVSPERVVLGGTTSLATMLGLEQYPRLEPDSPMYCRCALRQLDLLVRGLASGGERVLTPFYWRRAAGTSGAATDSASTSGERA